MINKLKDKLAEGKVVLGTFMTTNSLDIAEILALAGFDFVVIDTEHGPMTIETIANQIRALEARNCVPIVRVTENHDTTILRTLDVGAYGIHVPQINCKDDAIKMVNAAKYYPIGNRGFAITRSANYGFTDLGEYLQEANRETMLIPHIENITGVENIEEIIEVKDIDVLFIGPYDLSQSLGVPGQANHPKVQEAINRVLEVANHNGIPAGTFVTTIEDAQKRIEEGFKYITYNMDTLFLAKAVQNDVRKISEMI